MHPKQLPCPKCARPLEPVGEVTITFGDDALAMPVYQCDDCDILAHIGNGETMELPLTFCRDANGRLFDPADPDRDLTL